MVGSISGKAARNPFSPIAAKNSGGAMAGKIQSRSLGSGISTSTISTPASTSEARAASIQDRTSASMSSKKNDVGFPSRKPVNGVAKGISEPVIMACRIAASAALLVNGPSVSSVGESGKTPSVGKRPTDVLCPNIPFRHAGILTEPPVSEPIANAHIPAAVATPEPLEDPPGIRCVERSHGFQGVPLASLTPVAPSAYSTVLVLPKMIQPDCFNAVTYRPSGPVISDAS